MAFSFAHYCPHCRVPSEVYVNEPTVPEGTNSFRYQCPRCHAEVSYSPYRLMRASTVPRDGVVAVLCQAQKIREKTPETVICESSSDTVLLPRIAKKIPLPPSPSGSPSTERAKQKLSETTPSQILERKLPLSSLGVAELPSSEVAKEITGVRPLQEVAVLRGHRGWVKTVAFSANREMVVSGGQDGTVRLWKFDQSHHPHQTIPHLHSGGVQALALSPDGKKLASAAANPEGIVRLWDISSPKPRLKALFQMPKAPVEAMAFSPNGNGLALGCGDAILLWNLTKPAIREDAALKGHAEAIKMLVFSPDGSTLASASQDGTVRLWSADLPAARELAVLEGSKRGVSSLAFSPDGQMMAWGGQDHFVAVWDVNGNKPKKRTVLRGHTGAVRLIIFPSNGQTILSVDDKNTAYLWNLSSLSKTREWSLPGGKTVASLAGTLDGRYLVTGSMGVVTMFRLYPKAKNPSYEGLK
jgi:WD40 repeat protein